MVENPPGGHVTTRLPFEVEDTPALGRSQRLTEVVVAVNALHGDLLDAAQAVQPVVQPRGHRLQRRDQPDRDCQTVMQSGHHVVDSRPGQHLGGEGGGQVVMHPSCGHSERVRLCLEVVPRRDLLPREIPAVDGPGEELLDHREVAVHSAAGTWVRPATVDPSPQAADVGAADSEQSRMHLDVGIHPRCQHPEHLDQDLVGVDG